MRSMSIFNPAFLASKTPTTTKTYDHFADTGSSSNALASNVGGGVIARYGVKIITSSPAIGTNINKVKASLIKVGTPTGNITFTVRDASDVLLASGTLDAATLTTSYADFEVTLDVTVALALNYRVMIEYAGGSFSTNYIRMEAGTPATETGYETTYYDTAYAQDVADSPSMTFDSSPV